MKVQISPTARQQIAEFVEWWDLHRRASRVRVEDAVETALAAITAQPQLGQRYERNARYRLWRLKGTPYVLFYRIDEATETIWIAVAWSLVRGMGPALP